MRWRMQQYLAHALMVVVMARPMHCWGQTPSCQEPRPISSQQFEYWCDMLEMTAEQRARGFLAFDRYLTSYAQLRDTLLRPAVYELLETGCDQDGGSQGAATRRWILARGKVFEIQWKLFDDVEQIDSRFAAPLTLLKRRTITEYAARLWGDAAHPPLELSEAVAVGEKAAAPRGWQKRLEKSRFAELFVDAVTSGALALQDARAEGAPEALADTSVGEGDGRSQSVGAGTAATTTKFDAVAIAWGKAREVYWDELNWLVSLSAAHERVELLMVSGIGRWALGSEPATLVGISAIVEQFKAGQIDAATLTRATKVWESGGARWLAALRDAYFETSSELMATERLGAHHVNYSARGIGAARDRFSKVDAELLAEMRSCDPTVAALLSNCDPADASSDDSGGASFGVSIRLPKSYQRVDYARNTVSAKGDDRTTQLQDPAKIGGSQEIAAIDEAFCAVLAGCDARLLEANSEAGVRGLVKEAVDARLAGWAAIAEVDRKRLSSAENQSSAGYVWNGPYQRVLHARRNDQLRELSTAIDVRARIRLEQVDVSSELDACDFLDTVEKTTPGWSAAYCNELARLQNHAIEAAARSFIARESGSIWRRIKSGRASGGQHGLGQVGTAAVQLEEAEYNARNEMAAFNLVSIIEVASKMAPTDTHVLLVRTLCKGVLDPMDQIRIAYGQSSGCNDATCCDVKKVEGVSDEVGREYYQRVDRVARALLKELGGALRLRRDYPDCQYSVQLQQLEEIGAVLQFDIRECNAWLMRQAAQ